jgi:hypothetical protein
MRTLGSTIASIRGDINRGSDFDARIHEAIVNAIEFYRARRYGFNTGRSTYLVTAERTSLSADMISVDDVVLQVDGRQLRQLLPRTNKWINAERIDEQYTSEPIYYAIEDRQLRLYPAPDRSYSVVIWAHYDYTNISLSASDSTLTNPWLNEAYELTKYHAMAEVQSVYIGGDEGKADAAVSQGRANATEKELKRRANLEHRAAEIRPCI